MLITAGMKVKWTSGAGQLIGKVKEIRISMSAAGTMQPWLHINEIHSVLTGDCGPSGVVLCADDASIKGYRIKPVLEA